MIKVSVVIPIYNVEKQIRRCACSLFEQTIRNEIEFIFVDDCSPDHSMEILKKVVDEYSKYSLAIFSIAHEKNQGPSTARNTGLEVAKGKYIIFCDSDDWVEPGMYEKLYNKAVEGDFDIVGCDFVEDYENVKQKYCKQSFQIDGKACVEEMLTGRLHGAVWNKLVRREIYEKQDIRFPDGNTMWEDLVTSIKTCYYAKKIAYIPEALYHYCYNSDSLLSSNSLRKVNERIEASRLINVFFTSKKPNWQFGFSSDSQIIDGEDGISYGTIIS